MNILSLFVNHLGSFALFIIIYELIDQTSRIWRKYIERDSKLEEQATLQQEERTKQMRIDLLRQAVQQEPDVLQRVHMALVEMDRSYNEEDDETEPAVETPFMVYRGEPGPKETWIHDPQTM